MDAPTKPQEHVLVFFFAELLRMAVRVSSQAGMVQLAMPIND